MPRPASTAPDTMSPVLMFSSSPSFAASRRADGLRRLGFLVTLGRDDLRDDAVGRAELHGNHARVADDLATVFFQVGHAGIDVVDLDREMMDARLLAGRE